MRWRLKNTYYLRRFRLPSTLIRRFPLLRVCQTRSVWKLSPEWILPPFSCCSAGESECAIRKCWQHDDHCNAGLRILPMLHSHPLIACFRVDSINDSKTKVRTKHFLVLDTITPFWKTKTDNRWKVQIISDFLLKKIIFKKKKRKEKLCFIWSTKTWKRSCFWCYCGVQEFNFCFSVWTDGT